MIVIAFFALLLVPSRDSFAALPDWSVDVPSQMLRTVDVEGMPELVKIRASHRSRRAQALRKPRRSSGTGGSKSVFVTDPQTWQKLIERGKRSSVLEPVSLGGVVYQFHVLDTSTPVAGQTCPAGTVVDNTLYVYDGLPQAPGAELYPVRLAAECIADIGAPDALSVDADVDGKILNTDWLKSPGISSSHPTFEPGSRDRVFLQGLVDLFLNLP